MLYKDGSMLCYFTGYWCIWNSVILT